MVWARQWTSTGIQLGERAFVNEHRGESNISSLWHDKRITDKHLRQLGLDILRLAMQRGVSRHPVS